MTFRQSPRIVDNFIHGMFIIFPHIIHKLWITDNLRTRYAELKHKYHIRITLMLQW